MSFKLSNKTFYKRHINELKKYSENTNSLHILNQSSSTKIKLDSSNQLVINFKHQNLSSEIKKMKIKYDTILLTDIVEVVEDIHELFIILNNLLEENGKLIISSLNSKWYWLIKLFEKLNLKNKNKKYSYIYKNKFMKIGESAGFDFIKYYSRQFFPFKLLNVGNFVNSFLESFFYFFNFGIKSYYVFRKISTNKNNYSKTIIIPAKNEEGNLKPLFDRIPRNYKYEIIFSCGISEDNTLDVAHEIKNDENFFDVKVHSQSKNGKANAVWEAFEISNGETVGILDADISVDPEVVDDFFEVIDNNYADFVNGSRLVYQMEKGSMRFINLIGNRLFQNIVTFIIKVPLTDSLCGTKVFKRSLLLKIKWWQDKFKLSDPFGDFDLLFTAAYFTEKILEIPIHYKTRTYGKTQISRFKDGYKLIKYLVKSFVIFNSSRIKN